MEEMPKIWIVSSLGLVLGGVFGAVAQRTNFCTMGAISDGLLLNDWNRFRAWMLAIAVAITGSQLLHFFGELDLNNSIYLTTSLGWAGAIIGGLLFGFGMTLTSGCGNKTLVRVGTGNLKSLVVAILVGLSAYMTMRGLTGLARVRLEEFTNVELSIFGIKAQGIPDLIAYIAEIDITSARTLIILIIVLSLVIFCFKSNAFRSSGRDILAGFALGSLIPIAWYVTGVIGIDDFEPTPLASFSFVNPVGESLQYLMTFSGSTINFGIAAVGGVILGAFIAARSSGEFQVESFNNKEDMLRHIVGAVMMGIGGILALGCTVGQGISGMSTLALGSLIALISIITGGAYGIRYLEEGNLKDALKTLLKPN